MLRVQTSAQMCGNCKFWRYVSQCEGIEGGVGKCRRSAPAAALHSEHSISALMMAVWPLTASSEWCGCWRAN